MLRYIYIVECKIYVLYNYYMYYIIIIYIIIIIIIILETSTGPFYIKIMRFAGFLHVQIHSWNANVSWTLQFISSGQETAWYQVQAWY